ncbi:hypothetical protein [Bacillus paranthracis]|uniref:hypothetical protein n=1 Tax=Bacillus paranthracis TaxID=2026186 RepID=UPI002D76FA2B|nr:hypothetical protein [Bacillus paranthracis]
MTNLTANTTVAVDELTVAVEEKKYWLVDLQDHENTRESTLDDAKEFLKGHFDEEDYDVCDDCEDFDKTSEELMDEHFEQIDNADFDELHEFLSCIGWTIFEDKEELREHVEWEALKWSVEKALKKEGYDHMLCTSGLIEDTLLWYAVKDNEKLTVRVVFTEGEEAGKISIEDTIEGKEDWVFRKNTNTL